MREMPLTPPIWQQAVDDEGLSAHGFRVFRYLYVRLDIREFREQSVRRISKSLKIKPATAGRAIKELRERGFIEREQSGARDRNEGHRYRLYWSRRETPLPAEVPRVRQQKAASHSPVESGALSCVHDAARTPHLSP